jgi:single-stranded-DNA-specific exonuclease
MSVSLVTLPKPEVKERPINHQIQTEALKLGLDPFLSSILARRPIEVLVSLEEWLYPKLKTLSHPMAMQDMDKAAERVAEAIIQQEHIALETDHDCDGQTSHAVLYWNLVRHFKHPITHVQSYIGHRLIEGYGLSASVAKRILAAKPRPTVVITADNGSSDEPRIALLKMAKIDVIVTDHHEIPADGIPASAYACLNPTRPDCAYPDPCIAGCMVSWLLMNMVRQRLIARGHLPSDAPSLRDTLDFVAVGTIADCVSMAKSHNNRAIVQAGMQQVWAGSRPCWRILGPLLKEKPSSEDLGFKIGPLLNSDGRLDTAFQSVSFLLAETDEEAKGWLETLQIQNTTRKAIQKGLVQKGMQRAVMLVDEGKWSLCVYLEEGHSGVHGIAASRLKDAFGRPTVFFAPKVGAPECLTGSVRGIVGFHVRQALQAIQDAHPGLLTAFGGHQGAGGLTLLQENLSRFTQAFETAVRAQVTSADIGPVIWTDGQLTPSMIQLSFLTQLKGLEPFGREFDAPIFEMPAKFERVQPVGDGTHVRLVLICAEYRFKGVWFNCRTQASAPLPVVEGEHYSVIFSLTEHIYREQRGVELLVYHVE